MSRKSDAVVWKRRSRRASARGKSARRTRTRKVSRKSSRSVRKSTKRATKSAKALPACSCPDTLTKTHPIFALIPLSKVTFTQARISGKLSTGDIPLDKLIDIMADEPADGYPTYCGHNMKINYLAQGAPHVVYRRGQNIFQSVDNRRLYAAVKAACKNQGIECNKASLVSNDVLIPAIVHHPRERISDEKKKSFKVYACKIDKKTHKCSYDIRKVPNTWGQAARFRSFLQPTGFGAYGRSGLPRIT